MALRYDSVWTGLGGSPYFTSWFSDNAVDVVSCQNFVDAVEGFVASIGGQINNALDWNGDSIVTSFNPANGSPTSVTGVVAPSVSCSNTGEVLPLATQGLVHMHTGTYRNGREIRGRVFIPGPTELNNSFQGLPMTLWTDTLQAAADVFIADADAGWSVWSRPSTPEASDGLIVPITSAEAWANWAVLRSRRD